MSFNSRIRRPIARPLSSWPSRVAFTLLLTISGLAGCGSNPPNPPPEGVWTNWQIQAGTAITSTLNTYPSFFGALWIQGTQSEAFFSAVPSNATDGIDYAGAFNSSTQEITLGPLTTLYSTGFGFDFAWPATPYTVTPVTVEVYPPGCLESQCTATSTSSAVGVEIAPLNGTYTGTLTASTQSDSGQATLTLTQYTLPNSDGSFSLNGTLTFPAGSGFGAHQVGGVIRGEGINIVGLNPDPFLDFSGTASTNPAGTQITVSNLAFAVTASDIVTFTGTLTRQ